MATYTFTIEPTQNETIIKLTTSQPLVSGSYQYNNIDEAKNSPLAQQLFYLPFIKKVFITANFIALERFSIVNWNDVENEVKEQIENYLNNGGILVKEPKTQQKIPIDIYAETTPNPAVLKFVANKILVKQDCEFKNIETAKNAPLATALFQFPFVKEVFLSKNYISITKFNIVEWNEITGEIRNFIKKYITEGNPIVNPSKKNIKEKTNLTSTKDLDKTSKEIITILEEHIKPAVAADGGNILFKSYDKNTQIVEVILQGACSGCPSSTITLKNGIENMLQQLIPNKISEVIAVNF